MAKTAKKTTGAKKAAPVAKPTEKPLEAAKLPEETAAGEETQNQGALMPETPETHEEPETPKGNERDQEKAELLALVEEMRRQLEQDRPQVVQVMADTEKVTLRFQAECAADSVVTFGAGGMYGQVTGKIGTVIVPKSEWSRFMTDSVRTMLDRRMLIVLSGLDEEELELFGCNYQEGEVLDRNGFLKLLDMGRELVAVFPRLCRSHQEMIAKRFLTAYEESDPRAQDRDLITVLNELSKEFAKAGSKRRGLFTPILELMNARDVE